MYSPVAHAFALRPPWRGPSPGGRAERTRRGHPRIARVAPRFLPNDAALANARRQGLDLDRRHRVVLGPAAARARTGHLHEDVVTAVALRDSEPAGAAIRAVPHAGVAARAGSRDARATVARGAPVDDDEGRAVPLGRRSPLDEAVAESLVFRNRRVRVRLHGRGAEELVLAGIAQAVSLSGRSL